MLRQQLNESEEVQNSASDASNQAKCAQAHPPTNYGSISNNDGKRPSSPGSVVANTQDNTYRLEPVQYSNVTPYSKTNEFAPNDDYGNGYGIEQQEEFYEEDDYTDDEYEDEPYNDYHGPKENKCLRGPIRPLLSPFQKLGKVIYDAILLISDIDDVWESPALQHSSSHQYHINSSENGSTVNRSTDGTDDEMVVSTRHKLGVMFWFIVLITGYAIERSTFKILVDRTGPFRLAFGSMVIPILHATLLLTWMITKAAILTYHQSKKKTSPNSRRMAAVLMNTKKHRGFWDELLGDGIGLPIIDVGFMGFLDSLPLFLVSITGNHVAPIQTVVLIQCTIPLATLIAQFFHPEGKCYKCKCLCFHEFQTRRNDINDDDIEEVHDDALLNNLGYRSVTNDAKRNSHPSLADMSAGANSIYDDPTNNHSWGGLTQTHVVGSVFIFISIILAMIPPMRSLSSQPRAAWNAITYLCSCIFAAASQTYKEKTLLKYKSPIDSNQLNFTLSLCSLFSAMVFCPLLYTLQGLGAGPDWTSLYYPKDYSVNVYNTYQCFLGALDDSIQQSKYNEVAHCDFSWLISFLHVLSILSIGLAVDKITNAGAIKIMYRGLSGGIVAAIGSMFVYQVFFFSAEEYGLALNSWHVICSVILILGSEIYHRVSLEEPTFETVYPDLSNLYYDE